MLEQMDACCQGKKKMKEVCIEERESVHQDVDTNPSEIDCSKIKGMKVKERVTYKSSKRPKNALEMATKKRKYKVKEKSLSKRLQEYGNNVVHSSMDSSTIQDFVRELPPQQEFGIPIEDICNRQNTKNVTHLLQMLDPNFYQGYDLMSSNSIAQQHASISFLQAQELENNDVLINKLLKMEKLNEDASEEMEDDTVGLRSWIS